MIAQCCCWHESPQCSTWDFGTYSDSNATDALQDAKNEKFYVFANEGDIYTDAAGSEYSYVTVIDTAAAAVCLPIPLHTLHMRRALGATPPSGAAHTIDQHLACSWARNLERSACLWPKGLQR